MSISRRNFFKLAGITTALLAMGGIGFINQPKIGRSPKGDKLAKILKSPHYVNGEFQNLESTSAVSYTHLTLPTSRWWCRSRWSPYH